MSLLKRLLRNNPDPAVDDQTDQRTADDHAAGTAFGDRPSGVRDDDTRRDVQDDGMTTPSQGEPPAVPAEPAQPDTPDIVEAKRVLRIPSFSVLAPIAGWLTAWGAAALATAAVLEAGVSLGFGFGIADGSIDVDSGFWAGLWTLVIQGGAFVLGGYVAGRMARTRAIMHAVLAWFVAIAATAADAIVVATGQGRSSVLAPLRLPQWAGLNYDNIVVIPLVIFAAGALVAVIIGGALAAGANRLETTDADSGAPERDPRGRREQTT
jgi:hypothetical protein